MKYIILALALIATPATAQTTQFSNVKQSNLTGDHSGLSFLFDYSNGLRGEVLICEGGCSRHRLNKINVNDRGFTATVYSEYGNIIYNGIVTENRVVVTDNRNLNYSRNLHRCNRSAPINIKCYNHNDFRIR